jgi:hypothetical protein
MSPYPLSIPKGLTNDSRFLDSLQWVDKTYFEKHKNEDPSTLRQPYTNLQLYLSREGRTHKSTTEAVTMFLVRYGKRAVRSLAIFTLSSLPIFGPFVLPAVSFYTFNQFAGLGPATIVFGTGIFLPRRYLVIFLQSYFSSRSLMRELVSTVCTSRSVLGVLTLLARTILLAREIYQRAKATLVPGKGWPPLWFWRRVLHIVPHPFPRRVCVWNCRSINWISRHENHRPPTTT